MNKFPAQFDVGDVVCINGNKTDLSCLILDYMKKHHLLFSTKMVIRKVSTSTLTADPALWYRYYVTVEGKEEVDDFYFFDGELIMYSTSNSYWD